MKRLKEMKERLQKPRQKARQKLSDGVLLPAYGRDYRTKAEVIEDFRSGKDFEFHSCQGRTYCSIKDGVIGARVKLRFDEQKKKVVYVITEKDFMTR